MIYSKANQGRCLCQKLSEIESKIAPTKELSDLTDMHLRVCAQADPDELQRAFLVSIQERIDFPGMVGSINEETDELDEPFDSERPILEFLLHDMMQHLSIELQISVGKQILAEREASVAKAVAVVQSSDTSVSA